MNRKIRVLIADDHTLFREGLKKIIGSTSDLEVTGEARNGHETLHQLARQTYDVVVLDIAMPGRNGLDILKEITVNYPGLPILMLSMFAEEHYALRVLKAGASGYLTKESAPSDLIGAIRKVSQGRKHVTPSLVEKLVLTLQHDSDKLAHEHLSDREYQVMCMIASGKTLKEIASDLNLGVSTVSTYRSRVLEKMHMKGDAALIRYVIENNLI